MRYNKLIRHEKKKKHKQPKRRLRVECNGTADGLRWLSGKKGRPQRLRCKECGKRFLTYWENCNPAFEQCWHEHFPPHRKLVLE